MDRRFSESIYALLREVPPGRVTTYKELAHAVGCSAYRAVGTAMKNNPYAPDVPCHRVVASDGSIGGFQGTKSGDPISRKRKMLEGEGVKFKGDRIVGFEKIIFRFETH